MDVWATGKCPAHSLNLAKSGLKCGLRPALKHTAGHNACVCSQLLFGTVPAI